MGLLDKFKKGVSEAGNKAKITLEINRIKLQIASKRKEIESKYKLIGESYFNGFTQGSLDHLAQVMEEYCGDIIRNQKEIDELHKNILDISEEKQCACGKVVSLDTKFCPSCGSKFESRMTYKAPSSLPAQTQHLNCPVCLADLDPESKACSNCSYKL